MWRIQTSVLDLIGPEVGGREATVYLFVWEGFLGGEVLRGFGIRVWGVAEVYCGTCYRFLWQGHGQKEC